LPIDQPPASGFRVVTEIGDLGCGSGGIQSAGSAYGEAGLVGCEIVWNRTGSRGRGRESARVLFIFLFFSRGF
jgi:hypothetical protein